MLTAARRGGGKEAGKAGWAPERRKRGKIEHESEGPRMTGGIKSAVVSWSSPIAGQRNPQEGWIYGSFGGGAKIFWSYSLRAVQPP